MLSTLSQQRLEMKEKEKSPFNQNVFPDDIPESVKTPLASLKYALRRNFPNMSDEQFNDCFDIAVGNDFTNGKLGIYDLHHFEAIFGPIAVFEVSNWKVHGKNLNRCPYKISFQIPACVGYSNGFFIPLLNVIPEKLIDNPKLFNAPKEKKLKEILPKEKEIIETSFDFTTIPLAIKFLEQCQTEEETEHATKVLSTSEFQSICDGLGNDLDYNDIVQFVKSQK